MSATLLVLTSLTVSVVTAGFVLVALTGSGDVTWGVRGAIGLWGLAFGGIGYVIARRIPHIGLLLSIAGLAAGLAFFAQELSLFARSAGLDVMVADLAEQTVSWMWTPTVAALATALLLFPDGAPPTPRWKYVAILLWTVTAAFSMATIFGPPAEPARQLSNPLQIQSLSGLLRPLSVVGLLAFIPFQLLTIACLAALVVRYRASRLVQRQQLKWVMYAGAILAVTVVVVEMGLRTLGPVGAYEAGNRLVSLLILLLPAAMALAILRYRLYDIDLVIRRTLVYGVLTALLALVYAGSVVVLGQVLQPFGEESDVAVAGSTLAVAALFTPFRRRVQALVNRRFYRANYDAARTLDAFSARLREEVDLDTLSADLVWVVQETLQPAQVSLWLRRREAAN